MMAVQASQDHHVGRHHGSHKVSPKQASPRYCHDQCDFSYIEVKKKKKAGINQRGGKNPEKRLGEKGAGLGGRVRAFSLLFWSTKKRASSSTMSCGLFGNRCHLGLYTPGRHQMQELYIFFRQALGVRTACLNV